MPHLLGPAGAQSPASRNEVLLREEVDRLRVQLDAAREFGKAFDRWRLNPSSRGFQALVDARETMKELDPQ